MPKEEQDKIREERSKHKANKRVTSTIEAIMNESNLDARLIISAMTEATRARNVSQTRSGSGGGNSNGCPSASSNRSTMMGGRSEQADLRTRNRNVGAVTTRRVISSSKAQAKFSEPPDGTRANNEADSNADTCCLATNFKILSYTNKTADVYPYDSTYEPIANVPIVTCATAYTDPDTGQTYILVFNESL